MIYLELELFLSNFTLAMVLPVNKVLTAFIINAYILLLSLHNDNFDLCQSNYHHHSNDTNCFIF
jgi:hypothetical protein